VREQLRKDLRLRPGFLLTDDDEKAAGERAVEILQNHGRPYAQVGIARNVWQEPWSMRLGDLRYDAGPGLRFDTPFGRIRIDFGYQLRPLDGLRIDGKAQTSRWRFNFGIGEAF
jgi:hypothetical protein